MGTTILYIVIIALSVSSCLLQTTQEPEYITKIAGIYTNVVDNSSQNDAPKQELNKRTLDQAPPLDVLCYVGHMKCSSMTLNKDNREKQVCAYQKIHGLVNFQSPCEVALQNCLYKIQQGKAGREANDVFFYNGKKKPCEYYMKIGETIDKAVVLYYIDEFNYDDFTKEFEKVDKKNKYDFIDLVFT